MSTPTLAGGIPGDPALVEEGAEAIGVAGRRIREAGADVAQHADAVVSRWSGTTAAAAHERLRLHATQADAAGEGIVGAGPVLATYAAALRQAQEDRAAALAKGSAKAAEAEANRTAAAALGSLVAAIEKGTALVLPGAAPGGPGRARGGPPEDPFMAEPAVVDRKEIIDTVDGEGSVPLPPVGPVGVEARALAEEYSGLAGHAALLGDAASGDVRRPCSTTARGRVGVTADAEAGVEDRGASDRAGVDAGGEVEVVSRYDGAHRLTATLSAGAAAAAGLAAGVLNLSASKEKGAEVREDVAVSVWVDPRVAANLSATAGVEVLTSDTDGMSSGLLEVESCTSQGVRHQAAYVVDLDPTARPDATWASADAVVRLDPEGTAEAGAEIARLARSGTLTASTRRCARTAPSVPRHRTSRGSCPRGGTPLASAPCGSACPTASSSTTGPARRPAASPCSTGPTSRRTPPPWWWCAPC